MAKIKGVILAGGLGKRLGKCTEITNKHLLPVWDKPMIVYPLRTLLESGIEETLIVTGGKTSGEFMKLLGDGKDLGFKNILYCYQRGEGGISAALSYAREFAGDDPICVILGDNILQEDVKMCIDMFLASGKGAGCLLKVVKNPSSFGVPKIVDNKIETIIEKPVDPPSSYAVVGVYFFQPSVFDYIDSLLPSERGEKEVTSLLNKYIENDDLIHFFLTGWWIDAGTIANLNMASTLVNVTWIANGESFNKRIDDWAKIL